MVWTMPLGPRLARVGWMACICCLLEHDCSMLLLQLLLLSLLLLPSAPCLAWGPGPPGSLPCWLLGSVRLQPLPAPRPQAHMGVGVQGPPALGGIGAGGPCPAGEEQQLRSVSLPQVPVGVGVGGARCMGDTGGDSALAEERQPQHQHQHQQHQHQHQHQQGEQHQQQQLLQQVGPGQGLSSGSGRSAAGGAEPAPRPRLVALPLPPTDPKQLQNLGAALGFTAKH